MTAQWPNSWRIEPPFIRGTFVFIGVVSILILPKIWMRRILCYILYLSGDDFTICSTPFSCPGNIHATITFPETNNIASENQWLKDKVSFCASAQFQVRTCCWFQGVYLCGCFQK